MADNMKGGGLEGLVHGAATLAAGGLAGYYFGYANPNILPATAYNALGYVPFGVGHAAQHVVGGLYGAASQYIINPINQHILWNGTGILAAAWPGIAAAGAAYLGVAALYYVGNLLRHPFSPVKGLTDALAGSSNFYKGLWNWASSPFKYIIPGSERKKPAGAPSGGPPGGGGPIQISPEELQALQQMRQMQGA
jgi:hypothetical protein